MPLSPKVPLIAALVCSVLALNSAQGGLSSSNSWQHVSADGQFVLVMISPLVLEEDAAPYQRESKNAEIRRLRATYPQSGLYRNDGSVVPIWTTKYVDQTNVFLTGDGKYLVLADQRWRSPSWDVATFCANGKRLSRVTFFDLRKHIPFARFRRGPECKSLDLDEGNLKFTVRTFEGESFVFDVTTGSLIRTTSRYPLYIVTCLASIVGIAGLGCAFYFGRRRNNKAL